MKRGTICAGAVACATFGLAGVVQADVAFDNFTEPGQGYNQFSGWTVEGPTNTISPGSSEDLGYQFVSLATGSLTEIDVAADLWSGPNSLTIALFSDSSNAMGTQLGSWTVNGEMLAVGSPGSIVAALTGGPTINLSTGTAYWVAVSPGDPATFASWKTENSGDTSRLQSFSSDGINWNYETVDPSAFSVQVTPAPEPATIALIGFGAAALIRRRRKA